MSEDEIVYVYFGRSPERLELNSEEVASVTWSSFVDLKRDVGRNPDKYVFWLNHYLTQHESEINRGLAESW